MAFQKKIPCALAEGSIQCSWIWECWDAPVPVPLCMALPLLPEQGRITWSQNSQLWNLWERADIQEQQCGSAPPWRGGCSCFSRAARPGLCWVQPVPALHCSALPSASPDPTSAALGISERAVDRDNACWGPADGEKSLLLTSPRPCGSAGNLGDNWLDSFSPDGWKVLARMENNLSGVGILLAGAFWIKQSLCREVAEPHWPLQDLGAEFWLGDKCLVHVGWVLLLHPAPCVVRTHRFGQLEHRNIKAPLCLPCSAWFEGCECAMLRLWGTHCPPQGFFRLDFTEEEEKGWNCW